MPMSKDAHGMRIYAVMLHFVTSCMSCPWNASVCRDAARGSYLEYLRYAHEHGCPWDENTFKSAEDGGYADCIRYLQEHGCPISRQC